MSKHDTVWQEQRLEELLYTDLDPVSKVQKIVSLGLSEEAANSLVERHQLGLQNAVYYESLDFIDDDDAYVDTETDEFGFFTD
jgi:hypothetical protein